jgi:hypothetical protein
MFLNIERVRRNRILHRGTHPLLSAMDLCRLPFSQFLPASPFDTRRAALPLLRLPRGVRRLNSHCLLQVHPLASSPARGRKRHRRKHARNERSAACYPRCVVDGRRGLRPRDDSEIAGRTPHCLVFEAFGVYVSCLHTVQWSARGVTLFHHEDKAYSRLMTFLNPLYLIALAAAAIPIILSRNFSEAKFASSRFGSGCCSRSAR